MEQLVREGLVRDVPDIFRLRAEDLAGLDGWGEKSADNTINAIAAARRTSLAKLIRALGIRYIGEVNAGIIAERYPDLEALMAASAEDFVELEGIGPQASSSLREYFADPSVREMIRELFDAGVEIVTAARGVQPLAGQVFLFTGTLSAMSRNEAKQRVKMLGGQVASTISNRVAFLVAGEKAGSKLKKAEELGVRILNEQEFNRLLDQEEVA